MYQTSYKKVSICFVGLEHRNGADEKTINIMGCDIHMFAEKRNNKGNWEAITVPTFKSCYGDKKTKDPYDGRNYDLFAILADVRNGYGFAGINTGEGFNPISEPKGLPEDVSDEVKEASDRWDCDGHSHSWFTLKELIDYDWGQLTFKRGVVTIEQFKSLMNTGGSPDTWCGATSGPNIVTIDENVAEDIINGKNNFYNGKNIYVSYRWSSMYSERCSFFLEETIPALDKLGNQEDVRIVFWFDN